MLARAFLQRLAKGRDRLLGQNRYMAVGAGSKSDVDRPAVRRRLRRRPAANRRGQSQLPHDTLALVLLEPLTPHCVFNSVPWHCQGTFLPTRTS